MALIAHTNLFGLIHFQDVSNVIKVVGGMHMLVSLSSKQTIPKRKQMELALYEKQKIGNKK